jgi:DeoR/GlpR family transcriptional regulator of sugar metabolism
MREWTMERIAEALNVSQATITGDLRGLFTVNKPLRPKGGRPKGGVRVSGPQRQRHKKEGRTCQTHSTT